MLWITLDKTSHHYYVSTVFFQADRDDIASAGSSSSGEIAVSHQPIPPFRNGFVTEEARLDIPSQALAEVDIVSRM